MNKQKAIEAGYTHSGYMFDDVPVFVKFNDDLEESFEAVGINFFYQTYLSVLTWLDVNIFNSGKSFEIWLDENESPN